MNSSPRAILYKQRKNESLNVSFSSNNSFYEKLDDETKRDIINLIKSGKDKRSIIKLYILKRPSNVDEAWHYLSKEKGLYQHIFYSSENDPRICEICQEKENVHITHYNDNKPTINNLNKTTLSNYNESRGKVFKYTELNKIIQKCKICEDEISNDEKLFQCYQCHNYYCSDCLFSYIKELIKNGKSEIICPHCKAEFDQKKVEQIFEYNDNTNNKEIENLKKLFYKNKSKKIVLSNTNLIFCPFPDCEGYAKKISGLPFNKCNKGHQFCSKCGELWHKEGRCPEEEKVDKLFEQYYKKLNLKKCPSCGIITLKKGGCNHITCTFCKKNWCWLCQEIFDSADIHYGDINRSCYNRMMNNGIDSDICAKCENVSNNFNTFNKCRHLICNDCFENYLLEKEPFKLGHTTKIKCVIENCNQISTFNTDLFVEFIRDLNNVNIDKKYRKKILFYKYNLFDIIMYFYFHNFRKYLNNTLFKLYNLISNPIYFNCRESKGYAILEIIGMVFGLIFILIYTLIFPSFFYITIQILYYNFIKEAIQKYNQKLKMPIFIGIELLLLINLFPLIFFHYIYLLFIPILGLIYLIKKIKKRLR